MSSDDIPTTSSGQDKKGPWSTEEDAILRSCCQETDGTEKVVRAKWGEIATKIAGRCAKQCRERWEQNLKPTINKAPIGDMEGHQIILMVQQRGKKWAQIARELTGRSDNSVKNWYNGMVQKHKSRRNSASFPLYESHFSPEGQMKLEMHFGKNGGARAFRTPAHHRHQHDYMPYGGGSGRYAQAQQPQMPQYDGPTSHEGPTLPPLRSDVHRLERQLQQQYMHPDPQEQQMSQAYQAHLPPMQQHQQPQQQPSQPQYPTGAYHYPHAGGASAPYYNVYEHSQFMVYRPHHQEQERRSSVFYEPPTPSDGPGLSHSRDATPGSMFSSPQTPLDKNPSTHLRHASQGSANAHASALRELTETRGEDKEAQETQDTQEDKASSAAKMSLSKMIN